MFSFMFQITITFAFQTDLDTTPDFARESLISTKVSGNKKCQYIDAGVFK